MALRTLRNRRMETVGPGYLSLDRSSLTLSGGEGQRLKTVRHLGSSLTGVIYVFDEPSVGLHPRDVERLIALLHQLRDKGNIVLVVEHDRTVIEAADHVIDIGPGAGKHGGSVMFEGAPAELAASDTATGRGLREALPASRSRRFEAHLPFRSANLHNLRDIDVDFPLGVFTVVTGVAGSGKSPLTTQVLPRQHPGVVVIDQSAVGINPRSTPATRRLERIQRQSMAGSSSLVKVRPAGSEGLRRAASGHVRPGLAGGRRVWRRQDSRRNKIGPTAFLVLSESGGGRRMPWRDEGGRVRVLSHTCECRATVYELCGAGGRTSSAGRCVAPPGMRSANRLGCLCGSTPSASMGNVTWPISASRMRWGHEDHIPWRAGMCPGRFGVSAADLHGCSEDHSVYVPGTGPPAACGGTRLHIRS